MKTRDVWIVPTGTANTASVIAGIERIGLRARMIERPKEALSAGYLVLPGVGALAAAMQRLQRDDMVSVLQDRIRADLPTLAICLGLQLLCQGSEESPGLPALGVVDGVVIKYPSSVRVPQLGWNLVQPDSTCHMIQTGYAYFANSYRLTSAPGGWSAAYSDYAGKFVAALEKGRVLACQFHPELSGLWGQQLITRWLGDEAILGERTC